MITSQWIGMQSGVSDLNETAGNRPKVGREALLEAAAAIFFEQGYAATRIDDIIERTGGSKRNIYEQFGNKEGLFTAIVSDHAGRAIATLSLDELAPGRLRPMLLAFGRQLIDISLSPALLGVYRIATAEYARFPDLVRRFYDLGPGLASATLAKVLAAAEARGEIGPCDPQAAADHFVGMIRGNVHLKVMLGLREAPGEAERTALVASAVGIFLTGLGHRA